MRPTVEGGAEASRAVAGARATAVVAYNDLMAIGLMRGLQQLGTQIPEDVSVLGFDDIVVARLVTPGLTTVAAPLRTMGAAAVQNLVGSIGGAHSSRTDGPIVLPTRLVVRGSTGGPRPTRRRRTTNWSDQPRRRADPPAP